MALFNLKRTRKGKVLNKAGGQAYAQTPELALASMLLTSFAQDQYYRDAKTTFDELVALLPKVDAEFAAKAAIYARQEYGMRSITHVLAAELAAYASGQEWAKRFYDRVVARPDDMLEIATYYKAKGGKNLPNAMKKGFASAFDRFDGYQLAKYRNDNKALKLVDLVNLVRPVPTQRNAKALQQLVAGTLRNTKTWEAKLTQAGSQAEDNADKAVRKAQVWTELIGEGKLGYFALVRNLRNILEQAPELIPEVIPQLTDPKRIRNSKVMPFRLLTAYKQLNGNNANVRAIQKALDEAINISCGNLPALANTLVVIDNSGSMGSPVAGSQHLKCNEAGAAFAIMLAKRNNADIMEFADSARMIRYRLNESVLEFARNFPSQNRVGYGTNFKSIFETARKAYDRIVIFSDMQGWVGYTTPDKAFADYKRRTGADPFVYSIDLRGYGTMQLPQPKVFALAGFSDKVFEVMGVVERDPEALLKAIKSITL
jgi:60 kDa SS-A/Ro ribonucleoprotein